MVPPQQRTALLRALSQCRLRSYEQAAISDGATYQEVDLYVYGMALAGALWGPVHILEVATRNAIHDQLTHAFGRADWWESRQISLIPRQAAQVAATTMRLTRSMRPSGMTPGPDDVVAALDFGFWCGLLSAGLQGHDYERMLWQPGIRHAFPGSRRGRRHLWQELNRVRQLRNRIGHHEPVHDRDATRDLERMLRLTTMMSFDLSDFVAARSRVHEILAMHPRHGHRLDRF